MQRTVFHIVSTWLGQPENEKIPPTCNVEVVFYRLPAFVSALFFHTTVPRLYSILKRIQVVKSGIFFTQEGREGVHLIVNRYNIKIKRVCQFPDTKNVMCMQNMNEMTFHSAIDVTQKRIGKRREGSES